MVRASASFCLRKSDSREFKPLLLSLQLHKRAHHIDAGIGAGGFADLCLIVYGLGVGDLRALRSDARNGGNGLQIQCRRPQSPPVRGRPGREGGGAFEFLARLVIAARHWVVNRLAHRGLRLR